tara:strand:- start:304 stop:540 length:237 start_codon:yes stop_codon:yes gene_type:complete
MFVESPVSINPSPDINIPLMITFRGLVLSIMYPTNGDRNPLSTWRIEKAPESRVLETPKSLSIGRKNAVNPCHIDIPM